MSSPARLVALLAAFRRRRGGAHVGESDDDGVQCSKRALCVCVCVYELGARLARSPVSRRGAPLAVEPHTLSNSQVQSSAEWSIAHPARLNHASFVRTPAAASTATVAVTTARRTSTDFSERHGKYRYLRQSATTPIFLSIVPAPAVLVGELRLEGQSTSLPLSSSS